MRYSRQSKKDLLFYLISFRNSDYFNFFTTQNQIAILDSLTIHVGQIDTEWLFTKIVDANYHVVADLICQRIPAVSILFIKFSKLIFDQFIILILKQLHALTHV